MTPDEAPVGCVVVIGHPANGVTATKQADGRWIKPNGWVASHEDICRAGGLIYNPEDFR